MIKAELGGSAVEPAADTGFDGDLLVPFRLFTSLGFLAALSPDEFWLSPPDSRRLPLFMPKRQARVGGETLDESDRSSPEMEKRAVGREFLRSFVGVLGGDGEEPTLRRAGPHAQVTPLVWSLEASLARSPPDRHSSRARLKLPRPA